MHNQDLLTPPEETLRALDDLIRAGKVRYAGSSNHAGWTQVRALATADRIGTPRYIAQQIKYSLLDRAVEDELLPLGVAEGVGALVWGPLASGYLTGKFRGPADEGGTRLGQAGLVGTLATDIARRTIDIVAEIAAGRGVSSAQVALNWVVRKAGVSFVLVGARLADQLADNLAAADWSQIDDEIAQLDEASALDWRYPYDMHRKYAADRNLVAPLLPPVVPPHA